MSITLSSADLEHLARVTRLLASPLDHGSIDEWRSEVNGSLKELLHADSAGFLLPVADGLMMYSEEHDPEELALYPEIPPPPLRDGTPALQRMVELGVATLETAYGPSYPEYLNSAYYNEYAAPNGAHDTLAAGMVLGEGGPGIASLQFWHARPRGRRFGEREATMLRLLFPAFRAGVESCLRWSRQRENLLHTLGALGEPTLVCDLAGKILHRTPALEAVLAAEPEADALRDRLRAVALEVSRATSGKAVAAPPGPLVREARTRTARYHLHGCLYGGPSASGARLVVVGLKRLNSPLPSEKEISERFGLTKRQAEVARLLAQRLANREIADRLVISPHTALRHTEAVLRQLGLSDRRLVGERLREHQDD